MQLFKKEQLCVPINILFAVAPGQFGPHIIKDLSVLFQHPRKSHIQGIDGDGQVSFGDLDCDYDICTFTAIFIAFLMLRIVFSKPLQEFIHLIQRYSLLQPRLALNSVQSWMNLNSRFSCLCLPSVVITGVNHHTCLSEIIFIVSSIFFSITTVVLCVFEQPDHTQV